jgi:phosphatidylinositol glycan class H protein
MLALSIVLQNIWYKVEILEVSSFFYLFDIYVIFHSGRVHRQFVPVSKLLKPLLNECVTPVTCYWSLAVLLRDEDELMLVFKVNLACFQMILKCKC